MVQRADVAVVGGGILGLAHAWEAARRGHSVVLFERDDRARGASVRNFGTIWPIGQPPGSALRQALLSRRLWVEVAPKAGIWHDPCGSLHAARRPDEWVILQEFAAAAPTNGYECRLFTPDEARGRCPALRAEGLLGALWSPTEVCIDPRQAVARLPAWLQEMYGVELRFGVAVRAVEMPHVHGTDGQSWRVERVVVCGGIDFQTLFPEAFAGSGIRRCKLQMMRTGPQPGGWRLGPLLAGGLTLAHYRSFEVCPSLAALKQRIADETPELVRFGIHVMAAQNHLGEVVIGDSHEYDDAIEPFDKSRIDHLILDYLRTLVALPSWEVAERWHGVYVKHPQRTVFTAEPRPGVYVVTAPGGAGMTLGFGIAHDLWESWGEITGKTTEFELPPEFRAPRPG
jgi:FAD dependent oxidoreductase TIGR03364